MVITSEIVISETGNHIPLFPFWHLELGTSMHNLRPFRSLKGMMEMTSVRLDFPPVGPDNDLPVCVRKAPNSRQF
jgi:hypothetical protein